MTLRKLGTTALAAALALGTGAALAQGYPQQQQGQYPQQQQGQYPQQQGGYQQGQPGYGQGDRGPGGWDAPPPDFRTDIARQGFRDGLQGARSDFEAHRQPNSTYRPEYRRPPVPRIARNEYRQSYQRGYDVAMRHIMERRDDRREGYPPPPPPPGYQPR